MGKVTLVGRSLAREGAVFLYAGQADECSNCRLKDICQNLQEGKRYRIVKVREKDHDCPVHEDGKVSAVEVEEAPLEVSIPERKALEGAVVALEEECPLRWCHNHRYCRRDLFPKGQKVALVEVYELLECPRDLKLKRSLVELR
ncbi:MAG: UPF0179 family protein [Thermoplasmatota archaeon]